jgi:tetratricopeptide (TPR) repeat protein
LEAENHDLALKTLEQAMRVYPEEKALLKFYQNTLERKAQFARKTFIRDTCTRVSALLKDGQLDPAIRAVEAALEQFADEEVFQNLYKTLTARKRGGR